LALCRNKFAILVRIIFFVQDKKQSAGKLCGGLLFCILNKTIKGERAKKQANMQKGKLVIFCGGSKCCSSAKWLSTTKNKPHITE